MGGSRTTPRGDGGRAQGAREVPPASDRGAGRLRLAPSRTRAVAGAPACDGTDGRVHARNVSEAPLRASEPTKDRRRRSDGPASLRWIRRLRPGTGRSFHPVSGHVAERFATGTLLARSDDRDWRGLRAERWSVSQGEVGEILQVRDTRIIVMLDANLPAKWRRDGRVEKGHVVPGTVWVCPSGVRADMIHHYGEIRDSIHLFLPERSLSDTALREIGVDPDKVSLDYQGWVQDALIEQIARQVHAELLNPVPAGNLLVETLASALGAYLLRHHSNLASASVSLPSPRGALDPRRLQRVKDFIEAHLDRVLSVEVLANEACLSPFHFARAFKLATGMTPHGYLTGRRREKAKALIGQGRIPLAEVAHRCGFSSQAYFTTWFKHAVGTTPGAYRECPR